MVVGLEYHNPLFDPHEAFQKFKTHPFVKKILEGGKLVRYGAKTVPYGGWYSMPRSYVDGGLIIGDSASLLNSQRLKGIHTAIKSGMLAAETIYEALCAGDTSAKTLAAYPAENRAELAEERTVGRAEFPSGIPRRPVEGPVPGGHSIRHRRPRPDRSDAHEAGLRGISQTPSRPRARGPIHALQGRRQAHLRPPHRRLSLRHAPRRRSAVPSRRARSEYLRRPLRPRIRQSLPVFLPRGGLRDGHGKRRAETKNQRRRIASTARPATSPIPTRSSTGFRPKVAAARTTRECEPRERAIHPEIRQRRIEGSHPRCGAQFALFFHLQKNF